MKTASCKMMGKPECNHSDGAVQRSHFTPFVTRATNIVSPIHLTGDILAKKLLLWYFFPPVYEKQCYQHFHLSCAIGQHIPADRPIMEK